MASVLSASDESRQVARNIIDTYFKTTAYPYTRHHIDSYNTFLSTDMTNIVKSNPILIVKDLIKDTNKYRYKVEIFVGGESGTELQIGTPTISLQNTADVRLLFPNEARLRALTYAATVSANIHIRLTYTANENAEPVLLEIPATTFQDVSLFKMPIMLHSGYCILHNKPKEFLREAGECPFDHGGYFIVDGQEKVLVTKQGQAFNTLYITPKHNDPRDPRSSLFASIRCLSSKTRRTKSINLRIWESGQIMVGLPFVRLPIPLFVLFRALGFQSDKEIVQMMYPDLTTSEALLFAPKLQPSIVDAWPFMNTFTAIQYIKVLTKGYSVEHVLDIIRNQLFTHMPNDTMSQGLFLAECVRQILRVSEGFEKATDRDDIRNQRCITSGYSIQMLFANAYFLWIKAVKLAIDFEYVNNRAVYSGMEFRKIFEKHKTNSIFLPGLLTESIMKGFKGKWGTGLGEEKTGIIQAMSRLSYCDFMSHCRRVILEFDTSSKLQGPRRLHGSQFGYFCTNETPGGASIGVSKNMSLLTSFSTGMQMDSFLKWIRAKGSIIECPDVLESQRIKCIPLYINGGIFGYCKEPVLLLKVLKVMKRTGCLPYSTSISFSYRWRRLNVYVDEGRPLRPLVWLQEAEIDESLNSADSETSAALAAGKQQDNLKSLKTWRNLVLGTLDAVAGLDLTHTHFTDVFAADPTATLKQYLKALKPHTGALEYIDPYEQNEASIAMFSTNIKPESTHMEIHPSTILSFMTGMIPFSHHNQSVRNQLGDSQSKQALSIYATNWKNRFDNTANILCYGESQLTSTMYSNYLGEGKMPYGHNVVLAIAPSGFNQDDGIVFNYDAFERGLFRSINYRSYWVREEDDIKTNTKTRIGNPADIPSWQDLKPGLNYGLLDARGIIKEGSFCDENTVIVGAYMMNELGMKKDASLTPQVWTKGKVEKVVVVINNLNQMLVRVRIVQDRVPELGDKFSNRHGQKGTCGAMLRGHDMPRTASGIVPDMIMNPHAIPSRMTIGQNIEQLFGKALALAGAIGDGTAFMNSESPEGPIGAVLEEMGYEKYGNEILYNGMTGEQCKAAIFMGPVYGMKLKHMVEDKWQARGQGRKVQMTHQPTGGRGNQGGLKIGEMDRDALVGHSISAFFQESFMKRSDGTTMPICTSCGTVPIHNPKMRISQCTLCDGPPVFMGDTVDTLELLPPMHRQKGKIVNVEIPYATKVLTQELSAITNITLRFITSGDTEALRPFAPPPEGTRLDTVLKEIEMPSTFITPEIIEDEEEKPPSMTLEELAEYGLEEAKLKQAALKRAAERAPIEDEEAQTLEIPVGAEEALVAPPTAPLQFSPEQVARINAALAADGSEDIPVATRPLRRSTPLPSAAPLELPGIGSVAPAKVIEPPMAGLPPTIAIEQAKPPVFVVPTDDAAMAEAGLPPLNASQGTLRPLRRSTNNAFSMPSSVAAPPAATGAITVNKLG
jgi:DNA-directed RNA polymerase II subunit RPB2